jgi:hypothetical protein
MSLLHNDRDFEAIALHTALKVLCAPKKSNTNTSGQFGAKNFHLLSQWRGSAPVIKIQKI